MQSGADNTRGERIIPDLERMPDMMREAVKKVEEQVQKYEEEQRKDIEVRGWVNRLVAE